MPDSAAIRAARDRLAAAAQEVLDAWEQDADGLDPELGAGGVCQDVASAMSGVLDEIGVEQLATVFTEFDGGHVFLVAGLVDGVFRVDIPAQVYETGAGYAWTKRPGVVLTGEDVIVDRVADPLDDDAFAEAYEE